MSTASQASATGSQFWQWVTHPIASGQNAGKEAASAAVDAAAARANHHIFGPTPNELQDVEKVLEQLDVAKLSAMDDLQKENFANDLKAKFARLERKHLPGNSDADVKLILEFPKSLDLLGHSSQVAEVCRQAKIIQGLLNQNRPITARVQQFVEQLVGGVIQSLRKEVSEQLSGIPSALAKEADHALATGLGAAIDQVKDWSGLEQVAPDLVALQSDLKKEGRTKSATTLVQQYLQKYTNRAIFVSGIRVNPPRSPEHSHPFSASLARLERTAVAEPSWSHLPTDDVMKLAAERLTVNIKHQVLASVVNQLSLFQCKAEDLHVRAANLMQTSGGDLTTAFQTVLFNDLDQNDQLYTVKKIIIKWLYRFIDYILEPRLNALIEKLKTSALTYIHEQVGRENKFSQLENLFLQGASGYLEAFNQTIRKIPEQTGHANLQDAIESNLSQSVSEKDLHQHIASMLILELFPIIGYFINGIVNLFGIDWFNRAMTEGIDALEDENGYHYALTNGTNELLEDLYESYRNRTPKDDEEWRDALEKISPNKREEYRALVKNLFNAIQHSRPLSLEDCKRAAANGGFESKITDAGVTAFAISEVADLMASGVYLALRKDPVETQKKRLAQALMKANTALETPKKVTHEMCCQAENRQKELLELLLEEVVNDQVKSPQVLEKRRQYEVDTFIKKVGAQIALLTQVTNQILPSLAQPGDHLQLCKSLRTNWISALQELKKLRLKIDPIPIDGGTRNELDMIMHKLEVLISAPTYALADLITDMQKGGSAYPGFLIIFKKGYEDMLLNYQAAMKVDTSLHLGSSFTDGLLAFSKQLAGGAAHSYADELVRFATKKHTLKHLLNHVALAPLKA